MGRSWLRLLHRAQNAFWAILLSRCFFCLLLSSQTWVLYSMNPHLRPASTTLFPTRPLFVVLFVATASACISSERSLGTQSLQDLTTAETERMAPCEHLHGHFCLLLDTVFQEASPRSLVSSPSSWPGSPKAGGVSKGSGFPGHVR